MRWCPGPSVGRWSLESRVQLQTPSSCTRDLGEVVATMYIMDVSDAAFSFRFCDTYIHELQNQDVLSGRSGREQI